MVVGFAAPDSISPQDEETVKEMDQWSVPSQEMDQQRRSER